MLRPQMLREGIVRVQSATVVVLAQAAVFIAVSKMRKADTDVNAVVTANVRQQIIQASARVVTTAFASEAHTNCKANDVELLTVNKLMPNRINGSMKREVEMVLVQNIVYFQVFL